MFHATEVKFSSSQFAWLLLVLLASVVPAHAQMTATIRGSVVDEQGASLPGATVALTHAASGLERVATTDAAGGFELPNLPIGSLDVVITMPGFSAHAQRIEATGAVPLVLNAALKVAGFTDTVRVVPAETVLDELSAGT
ncbi:MAG: hypothetical protein RLZZ53_2044, partial [Acidobacteriota bacterium]